jgi:hypothetical protein
MSCPVPAPALFVVAETDAAAIRTGFDRGGERSAAIELRRLFPGITDNEKRSSRNSCAISIAMVTGAPSAQNPLTEQQTSNL